MITSEPRFDLVVIGSGPAGQKGAIAAAKLGKGAGRSHHRRKRDRNNSHRADGDRIKRHRRILPRQRLQLSDFR